MSGRRRLFAIRLLRLYPRPWRDRYEPEVRALLEEHRVRLITLADLVAGAIDARLDPAQRFEEELMPKSGRGGSGRARCSFCGKGRDQVKRLVAGPGVYICKNCVDLCHEVLATEDQPPGTPPASSGPPPRRESRADPWNWLRNIFRSTAPNMA